MRIRKRSSQPLRPVVLFMFLTAVCLPIHTLTFGGVGILMMTGVPLVVFSLPSLLALLQKKRWDPAMLLLIGFLVYNVLAYLWTPTFSTWSLYNYLKIVVIVVCLYCQTYSPREKKFLTAGAVLSGMLVCFFMLTERNIGYRDGRVILAVLGVEQDPNYVGYLFLIPMAVAVQGVLRHGTLRRRLCYLVLAVVILFCVMMTGSRGAFLGIAVIVAVCVLQRFRRMSTRILFCLAMALMAALAYGYVLSLLPDYIAARFSVRDVIESRGTNRLDIWLDALAVVRANPGKLLIGFGTGSSHHLLNGWAAHNLFIQLLLEGGIVGLGLFVSFLLTWLKRLGKKDVTALSILLGSMAMAMTLSVNTIYYFWMTFILGIVCSDAYPTGNRENNQ